MQPAQVEKTPKMLEIEKRFGKKLEEILREEYITKRKCIREIADELDVQNSTVSRWFRNYNISIRNMSEIRLPVDFVKPSKEQLFQWYVVKGMTTVDIGKKLGISDSVIGRWLRNYGIPARNPRDAQLPSGFVRPSKRQLHQWYVVKHMSIRDIARKLGIGETAVGSWLHKYDIQVRAIKTAKLPTNFVKPSEEQLYQWYIVERQSTLAIGKKLGVNSGTVSNWLHKHNIQLRSAAETLLPSNFVKPSKRQLYQWYVIKGMNAREIGEEIGVTNTTIRNWLRNEGILVRGVSETRLPVGFAKPPKEQLEQWYLVERLSLRAIGEKLGICEMATSKIVRDYGINIRNASEARLPQNFVKPSKEQLYQWYIVDKMSTRNIARRMGVDKSTIGGLLREYSIAVRNGSEARLPAGTIKPSKKQLVWWYIIERKSSIYIGKQCGVSYQTILRWLRQNNVPLRKYNCSYNQCNKDAVKELLKYYVEEKKYA